MCFLLLAQSAPTFLLFLTLLDRSICKCWNWNTSDEGSVGIFRTREREKSASVGINSALAQLELRLWCHMWGRKKRAATTIVNLMTSLAVVWRSLRREKMGHFIWRHMFLLSSLIILIAVWLTSERVTRWRLLNPIHVKNEIRSENYTFQWVTHRSCLLIRRSILQKLQQKRVSNEKWN